MTAETEGKERENEKGFNHNGPMSAVVEALLGRLAEVNSTVYKLLNSVGSEDTL